MSVGRVGHTATLLDPPFCRAPAGEPGPPAGYPCGQVLVVGGAGDGEAIRSAPSTAELFDPATHSWTLVAEPVGDFSVATDLCAAVCDEQAATVGDPITVTISGLDPATTYYYAVAAVNDFGTGPPSAPAQATTAAKVCPPAPAAGPGQVLYPPGWSLAGLPPGTTLATTAPIYGWVDQGAGGRYRPGDAAHPPPAGQGYWAFFTCATAVAVPGPGPATVRLALGAYHASMVADPTNAPVTVSGFDYAARWDPAANSGAGGYIMSGYRQAQTLAVGQGMWVFSYTRTTVVIAR